MDTLYLSGMALFLMGSVLAATAVSMPQLILYRVIQGTGAGAIAPSALASIGDLFPSQTRGRAFGVMGAVSILANLAGPLFGGWITDNLSWRWGFALILPIGGLAALLAAIGLPAHKAVGKHNVRLDWQGAALLGAALSGILIGLQAMGTNGLGWGTAVCAGAILVFILGMGWEKRHPDPVLPLLLLRQSVIKTTLATALFLGVMTHGAIAYIPLFMRETQGATATQAGIALLPLAAASGAATIIGGWAASRWARQVNVVAWLSAGAGALLLAIDINLTTLYIATALIGVGIGLLLPVLLHVALDAAGEANRAAISGAVQLARNLGGAAGVPLLGIWLLGSAEIGVDLLAIFASLAVVAGVGFLFSLKKL